jgi:hypothetical protein
MTQERRGRKVVTDRQFTSRRSPNDLSAFRAAIVGQFMKAAV